MKIRALSFVFLLIISAFAISGNNFARAQIPNEYTSPNDGSILTLLEISADSPSTVISDGTYHTIRAKITIEPADTLIINAGEKLSFEPYVPSWAQPQIVVKGRIFINGTETQPVVLTRTEFTSSLWLGIQLNGRYSTFHNSSRISNATFEYAGDASNFGLVLNCSSATVENCTFRNCGSSTTLGGALFCLASNCQVRDCNFVGNCFSIRLEDCYDSSITNCSFSNTTFGFADIFYSKISFYNCTFDNASIAINAVFSNISMLKTYLKSDYGINLENSTLHIENSTIVSIESTSLSFILQQNSVVDSLDSIFDKNKVSIVDANSVVNVKWHTSFYTYDEYGNPFPEVELLVTSNQSEISLFTNTGPSALAILEIQEYKLMNANEFYYPPYTVKAWKNTGSDNFTSNNIFVPNCPSDISLTMRALEPNVTIIKNSLARYAIPGDEVNFVVYYNNTGGASSYDVYINDTLPSGLEYISNTLGIEPMFGDGMLTWYLPEVPVGEHSFNITTRVSENASGTLVNNITYEHRNEFGKAMNPSFSNASVEVIRPQVTIYPSTEEGYTTPGGSVHVRALVENPTDLTIHNATMRLILPENCTLLTRQVYTNTTITKDLLPGMTGFIWKVYTPYMTDGTLLRFVYNLTWNCSSTETFIDVPVYAPKLDARISISSEYVRPDDVVQINVSYSNLGNESANDTLLTIAMPEHLLYISDDSGISPLIFSGIISYNLGLVPPGEHNFTINAKVSNTSPLGLGYVNSTILYKYYSFVYPPSNASAQFRVISENSKPVIELQLNEETKYASPGSYIQIELDYSNIGDLPAFNGTINLSLSQNLNYISDNSGISVEYISPGEYFWKISTIPPGKHNFTILINVNESLNLGLGDLADLLSLEYINATITYSNSTGELFSSTDSVSIGIVNASLLEPNIDLYLALNKTQAQPYETINMTIFFNNTGFGNSQIVHINLSIPNGLVCEYSSINPTRITPFVNETANVTIYEYQFVNVHPGEHHFYLIIYSDIDENSTYELCANLNYTNSTSLISKSTYSNIQIKKGTFGNYLMTVSITSDVLQALPGSYVNYTIVVTNTGSNTIENASLQNKFPLNLDFVWSNIPPTNLESNITSTLTWTFSDLQPGEYQTISVFARIKSTVRNGTLIYNNVTLTYTTADGNISCDASSTLLVIIPPAPAFTLEIFTEPTEVSSNKEFQAVIEFNNVGNLPAECVWLNVTVGAAMIFVSSPTPPTSGTSWKLSNVSIGPHSLTLNMRMKKNLNSNVYTSQVSLEYYDGLTLVKKTGVISVSIPGAHTTDDGGITIDCMTCFIILGVGVAVILGVVIAVIFFLVKGRKEKKESEYSGPIYANPPTQSSPSTQETNTRPPEPPK